MLRCLRVVPTALAGSALLLPGVLSSAAGQCPNGWQPGTVEFGGPPFVFATTTWDPDGPGPAPDWLVIAGDFFEAAGQHAGRIAAWDGERWHTLGGGFPVNSAYLTVSALTVYNGRLIAGGRVETAPGEPQAGFVAQWDGQAWVGLTPFVLPQVSALCVHDSALIAGTYQGVARWDGQSWQTLGANVGGTFALASYNGQLIQGTSAFDPMPVVWSWDGAAWQPMNEGLVSPFQTYGVSSLLVRDGDLFATGYIATAESGVVSVARWNGQRWEGLLPEWPTNFNGCFGLASYGGEVITAASEGSSPRYALMAWNGVAWRRLLTFPAIGGCTSVFTLCPFADRLFVGGFDGGGCASLLATGVATWDGQAMAPVDPGVSLGFAPNADYPAIASLGTLNLYRGRLVAGGGISRVFGGCGNGLAVQAGAGWRLPDGCPVGAVDAATVCGDRLIVTGRVPGALYPISQVASWDGAAFVALGPQFPNLVLSVACLQQGPVVITSAYPYPNAASSLVLRWDGGVWVPIPRTEIPLFAPAVLAVIDDVLYVGGLDDSTTSFIGRVAAYDGAHWSYVGGPIPIRTRTLSMYNGRLIAGGDRSGSPPAGIIMQWDGADWTPMGAPTAVGNPGAGQTPTIHSLLQVGADLIAAGNFSRIGNTAASSVAAWDGAAWREFNGGVSGDYAAVNALLLDGSTLYMGGSFRRAGGQFAPLLARWGPGAPACYPNCDCSTTNPVLSVVDFTCFISRFVHGDLYANCDGSTTPPVLNIADFTCFLNRFAAGCS